MNEWLLPDGQRIAYRVVVSARRRTLGLRINGQGLSVYLPQGVPLTRVDDLLRDKADWISRNVALYRARQPVPQAWHDGAMLQYLGQPVRLCLIADATRRTVEFDGARLYLPLPQVTDAGLMKRRVIHWFYQRAEEDFSRRLALLAAKLGVAVPPLKLTNARTRWGSCNSRGQIRLHWRLIQAPPPLIQYVVAHELAHLKEMNHSPRFWAWVEKICPDYRVAEQQLKQWSAVLYTL